MDAGGSDASIETDAAACFINAATYDQSCSVDSDCLSSVSGLPVGSLFVDLPAGSLFVQSGNYCTPLCICGDETISKGAVAQYVADVSKTPIGSGALAPSQCYCPSRTAPCCQAGRCSIGCLYARTDSGPGPTRQDAGP
jgi:hypothetical protein